MNGGDIGFRLAGRFGDFRLAAEARIAGSGLTALVGPSGSGKTTLLRCLAGLARAEGRIEVGGVVWQDQQVFTPVHRRGVGYVFQEPSLLPHLSVKRNLDFAARRAGDGPGPGFEETVATLGLGALLHRAPQALSGGERQRVAIARALLSRPALLLMDEPLSNLDAAGKSELMPYLEALHRSLALPVIYVSHDAGEVARLADRVLRMEAGRILEPGPSSPDAIDPLEGLSERQIRTLARAALASGAHVSRESGRS